MPQGFALRWRSPLFPDFASRLLPCGPSLPSFDVQRSRMAGRTRAWWPWVRPKLRQRDNSHGLGFSRRPPPWQEGFSYLK